MAAIAEQDQVALLVTQVASGDGQAREKLLVTLYDQLRAIARRKLASERAGHTLSATALVHEAFLKLGDQKAAVQNRAHFLAVASLAMRRVLVSHARRRAANKRGGGQRAVTLDDALVGGVTDIDGMLALDTALDKLEQLSKRQALAVTHKGFAAMTDKEIADALGVSVPTVRRDLRVASAFLKRELAG